MKRKLIAAGMALALLLPLNGCLNGRSLDQFGYVIGLGFESGDTEPYRVTLMLQKTNLENNAQSGGGFTLVTAECRNLFEAIDTVSAKLPYLLDFSRVMLLIVEDRLLYEEGVLDRLMNISYAKLHIRYNVNLFVSLGSAEETMRGLENELDPNLSRLQANFNTYSKTTGLTPIANIAALHEAINSKAYDLVVPLCGMAKEPVRITLDSVGQEPYAYVGGSLLVNSEMTTGIAGSALLCDGTMCGILSGQNTQLLLMATGAFHTGRMQLENPDGEGISVWFRAEEQPKIRLLRAAHRAEISISLIAEVEMPETNFRYDSSQLSQCMEQQLIERLARLYQTCRDTGSDAFCLGKYAIREFRDTASWEAYDWASEYKTVDARFTVEIKLTHNPGKSILE